jgi:hypothetical protein
VKTVYEFAYLVIGGFLLGFVLFTGIMNQLACSQFSAGSGPAACGLP